MRQAAALVFLGLGVCACTGPTREASVGPAEDMAGGYSVVGSIIDLQSQPRAGVVVALCHGTCRKTVSDAGGAFRFEGVMPDPWSSLSAELPQSVDGAKVVIPLYPYPVDPQRRTMQVPPLVLPRLGAAVALTGGKQPVAVDATLSLSVDGSALKLPAGSPRQIAGVRIPKGLFPDFCIPSVGGVVVAEWALGPFGVTSSAPIGVRIGENLGLAAGTRVYFFAVDPDLGRPNLLGTGSVRADGSAIESDTGVGLDKLTWLLVGITGGGGP